MPTDTDVAIIGTHVARLRSTLDALEKTVQDPKTEISIFVVALYQDAIETMREGLATLECEQCERPAIVSRKVGNFCDRCEQAWFDCDGCGGDLNLANVIVDELGNHYHGACVPYRGYSTEHDGQEDGGTP